MVNLEFGYLIKSYLYNYMHVHEFLFCYSVSSLMDIDPETLLEWLSISHGTEWDIQLTALEQLCMSLLMSDNVDKCFDRYEIELEYCFIQTTLRTMPTWLEHGLVQFSPVVQMQLILRLHCHWKPSQSGTVLKIAPCWLLTGSVYTAIIKAVRVLSILI